MANITGRHAGAPYKKTMPGTVPPDGMAPTEMTADSNQGVNHDGFSRITPGKPHNAVFLSGTEAAATAACINKEAGSQLDGHAIMRYNSGDIYVFDQSGNLEANFTEGQTSEVGTSTTQDTASKANACVDRAESSKQKSRSFDIRP